MGIFDTDKIIIRVKYENPARYKLDENGLVQMSKDFRKFLAYGDPLNGPDVAVCSRYGRAGIESELNKIRPRVEDPLKMANNILETMPRVELYDDPEHIFMMPDEAERVYWESEKEHFEHAKRGLEMFERLYNKWISLTEPGKSLNSK